MAMRMPETCWAVFKRQAIQLRDWCIWLVDLFEYMMMHGLTNHKFHKIVWKPAQRKSLVSHRWTYSGLSLLKCATMLFFSLGTNVSQGHENVGRNFYCFRQFHALYLIIIIIFGKNYELRVSPLRSFCTSVILSLRHPNITLSTTLQNTFNPCS